MNKNNVVFRWNLLFYICNTSTDTSSVSSLVMCFDSDWKTKWLCLLSISLTCECFLLLLLLLFLLNKFHARKKKKHLNSNVDWCLATFSDSSNVLENIPECRLEYLPICLHSFLKAILWIIFNVNTHNFRISYLWRFYFLKCSLFTLFFSFYRFVNKYFTF